MTDIPIHWDWIVLVFIYRKLRWILSMHQIPYPFLRWLRPVVRHSPIGVDILPYSEQVILMVLQQLTVNLMANIKYSTIQPLYT